MILSIKRIVILNLAVITAALPMLSYGAEVVATTSASSLYRQSHSIIRESLSTPLARTWANARIELYTDTLKYIQKLSDSSMDIYAWNVARDAARYLGDIQSDTYVFDISVGDHDRVESHILSYQQELVSYMRLALEKARTQDFKETGDMHFTLRMTDMSLDIHVDRYTFTQGKDLKNKELDGKIRIRATGKEFDGDIVLMFDGKISLIGNDLYLTLRDYTMSTPTTDTVLDSLKDILSGIRGKTYHEEIDREIIDALDESEKSLELADELLTILNTESILTPIARQGDDYILMFQEDTLRDINAILKNEDISSFTLETLMIPVDIRMRDTEITMNGYLHNTHIQGILDRDATSKKVLLSLKGKVHDIFSNWSWELSRTAQFWAYASATDEYAISAKASDTSVTASVKKGDKTILSGRIDTTGIDAWSYDLTAIWEYITYDWDRDEEISNNIVIRLWGKVKQEFGMFTLVPPTLYEELENSMMRKVERDATRKSDIEVISWALYSLDKYPKNPKNGCVTSIPLRSNGASRFSYYSDEKSLAAGTCTDGYHYRLTTDAEGNSVYILAARVETPDAANYDNTTLDITGASYEDIITHISTGTLDASHILYYVETSDNNQYDYYRYGYDE